MHKPSAKSSFSVDSPVTAHTYGRGKAVISLTAPPPVWASLPSSMAKGIAEHMHTARRSAQMQPESERTCLQGRNVGPLGFEP